MKLTLRLEVDEANKHWVDIDLSAEDLKKPTDMIERINQAWACIRQAYYG